MTYLGLKTVEDVYKHARNVVETDTGINLDTTPFTVKANNAVELRRYQQDGWTVDYRRNERGRVRLSYSQDTDSPDRQISDPANPYPTSKTYMFRSDLFGNGVLVSWGSYVGNKSHGIFHNVINTEHSISHLHYGKLHNAYGPAVIHDDHRPDEYWLQGDQLDHDEDILTAINTTDPTVLAECCQHYDNACGYFAAHNPNCPETARAEYWLAQPPGRWKNQ